MLDSQIPALQSLLDRLDRATMCPLPTKLRVSIADAILSRVI